MIIDLFKKYINSFKGFSNEIKALALITFINRAGTMVVPFLSKYLLENLKFSYSQIGWVMVFFGLGSLLGTWLSGKLSDKIGFYKVMIFSLFTSGIVFILLQFANTFYQFCMGVFILTTVSDLYRPAMLLSIETYSKEVDRVSSLSLVRSAVNFGFLFGPLLGGLIILSLGYNYLFYIDGITCIFSVLIFYFLIKEKKSLYKIKDFQFVNDKFSIFDDKLFFIHFVVTFITGLLFFQIFTTLSLYYHEYFKFSSVECGLFLALNGVIILIFELNIVKFIEKKGTNVLKVVAYGLLLMSISYVFLVINKSIFCLVLMMVFMTIGIMLTFPFAHAFTRSRVIKKHRGQFIAIFTMSYSIAQIVATKIGMLIVAKYSYNANWVILSGIGFVGFILAYCLVLLAQKEQKNNKNKLLKSLFKSG